MTEDTSAGRDHNGRFTRQVDTVHRDADAVRLRACGKTYAEIANALGYGDKSAARKAVERGLAEVIEEPAAELRTLELERLDRLTAVCWEVLEREHVTVSHGHVVRREVGIERDAAGAIVFDGAGKPIPIYEDLLDDGPSLQAVDRLLRIQQRRAALLGLDAPQKQEIGGQLRYEVVGVDIDQL